MPQVTQARKAILLGYKPSPPDPVSLVIRGHSPLLTSTLPSSLRSSEVLGPRVEPHRVASTHLVVNKEPHLFLRVS